LGECAPLHHHDVPSNSDTKALMLLSVSWCGKSQSDVVRNRIALFGSPCFDSDQPQHNDLSLQFDFT
jgi:hypothetical protein